MLLKPRMPLNTSLSLAATQNIGYLHDQNDLFFFTATLIIPNCEGSKVIKYETFNINENI